MRSQDQILKDVRSDILDEEHPDVAPLWVQHRMIEVMLDIRDQLSALTIILGSVEKIAFRSG